MISNTSKSLDLTACFVCIVLSCISLTGCGGSAEYEFPEATQKVTKIQAFRDTVKSYAESGQLDSGVELLREAVDGLKDSGVSNTAEIRTEVENLVKSKSSADVKKNAEKILSLLPDSDSPVTTE